MKPGTKVTIIDGPIFLCGKRATVVSEERNGNIVILTIDEPAYLASREYKFGIDCIEVIAELPTCSVEGCENKSSREIYTSIKSIGTMTILTSTQSVALVCVDCYDRILESNQDDAVVSRLDPYKRC